MKRCSAKPYEGQDNYIFVSYCHKDRAYVFPIIEQLAKDGYRVWYDEGIDPGSEWPEVIANHLNNAQICLAFITTNSIDSHNCRREINFALNKRKYFISVILEPVKLTLGMEMQLSSCQSIYKYNLSSEKEFFAKLYGVKELEKCKGNPNYSVEVSSQSDYMDEMTEIGKTRDTFSDRWFSKGDIENQNISNSAKLERGKAEKAERRRAEEEARKAAEEAERSRAEEEARKAAEEAERSRAEEEARRAAEEAERRRTEEEARKAAEEAERRRAEEEARKAAEEAERRRAEEAARKAAEEAENRKSGETANQQISRGYCHALRRNKTNEIIILKKNPFTIGRSEKNDDYSIPDNHSISRGHASLTVKGDICYITDNKSMNKTYINGLEIRPQLEYPLTNGDMIRISNESFLYVRYSVNVDASLDFESKTEYIDRACVGLKSSENDDEVKDDELLHETELVQGHQFWNVYQKALAGDAEWQTWIAYKYYYGISLKKDYRKALGWYERAAKQGNDTAMYSLANMYYTGIGTEINLNKAFEWFSQSADKDNPQAEFMLAEMYYHGNGIEENHDLAFEWYEKAAKKNLNAQNILRQAAYDGDPKAKACLGELYYNGIGLEKNLNAAFHLFKEAVGEAKAQFYLGEFFSDNYIKAEGLTKDDSKAFSWYKQAAEKGYVESYEKVGSCYYHGRGVEVNFSEAFKWCERSVNQGCKTAYNLLGKMYAMGQGIDINYTKAFELFEKDLQETKYFESLYIAGFMCENGIGIAADIKKAQEYFTELANKKYVGIEFLALWGAGPGGFCMEAFGEKYSSFISIQILENIARQGNSEAQYYLGRKYHMGWGCKQDDGRALEWLRMAEKNGYEGAEQLISSIG